MPWGELYPTKFLWLIQKSQGRYLPVFAGEVVDKNAVAAAEGRPTINLKSVLIGNGITDYTT